MLMLSFLYASLSSLFLGVGLTLAWQTARRRRLAAHETHRLVTQTAPLVRRWIRFYAHRSFTASEIATELEIYVNCDHRQKLYDTVRMVLNGYGMVVYQHQDKALDL